MSESNIQLKSEINISNKNFHIPHPGKKKGSNNNIKNINNLKNKIRNSKIDNISLIKNNIKGKLYNSQIENGGNNIFDSLINLSKPKKTNENYIDDKEEKNSIEKKLSKAKRDMEDVKENINKLNQKMINIKNNSEQLEINKSNCENELINLISNKETLEEMYNTEITYIKNRHCDNSCEIKVSKEEIQNININKFTNQIITLIKTMNNENKEEEIDSNNPYFNYTSNIINQIYSNFINQIRNPNFEEKTFSIFFSSLFKIISDKLNTKYPFNVIKSLLHYLIKFNIINEQIRKCENFIEIEYKIQKEKIDEEMIELTMALIFYENHKHEILNLTSKLQDEINEKNKIKENRNYIKENHTIDLYDRDSDDVNPENIYKHKELTNFDDEVYKEINNDAKSINESIVKEKNKNKIKLGISDITIEKLWKGNAIENKRKKRQIYENYLNNGIYLNINKKKKNQVYLNSISEYNNKTNISYNYNFNTNFLDIKPIERKIEKQRKNILTLRNIFNLNNQNRKKYNSNANLNEFNTNPVEKKIENKSIKINRNLKNGGNKININYMRMLNNLIIKKNFNQHETNNLIKNNKTTISNEEKPMTTYKKGNLNNNKILNTKTFLPKNHKNNSSMKNIHNKISNTNLILNINNNTNFNSKDTNRIQKKLRNASNFLTDEVKDININLNKLFELKEKDNNNKIYKRRKITKTARSSKEKNSNKQLKTLKKEKMESFCYFKFLKIKDNKNKFNPLNVLSINPEYFDYYECYISIDFTSGCIKISPKISLEKIKYIPSNNKNINHTLKNSFNIEMKLRDVTSVKLEKYTKDIIQIQNILSKNKIKANNNFSINRLLNIKEIKDINIEQSEKIKAVLCNFFPFSFVIENNIKIDLVFINYEQFDIWLRILKSIAYNNLKFSKIRKSYTNYN